MTYEFKYRYRFFWRTRKVVGHRYDSVMDRMILYYPNGLEELCQWSFYDLRLGADWVLAEKKAMEAKAGQAVPVNAD